MGPDRRPGFTLAELLVAMSLMLIVLTVCLKLLFPTLELSGLSSSSTQAQQEALLVVRSLRQELAGTFLESIAYQSDPPALALHPVRRGGAFSATTGAPLVEDWVLVYALHGTTLSLGRRRPMGIDFSDDTLPQRPTPAALASVASQNLAEDRILSRHTAEFEVGDQDLVGSVRRAPLRIRVKTALKGKGGWQTWEAIASVTPRNVRW